MPTFQKNFILYSGPHLVLICPSSISILIPLLSNPNQNFYHKSLTLQEWAKFFAGNK